MWDYAIWLYPVVLAMYLSRLLFYRCTLARYRNHFVSLIPSRDACLSDLGCSYSYVYNCPKNSTIVCWQVNKLGVEIPSIDKQLE